MCRQFDFLSGRAGKRSISQGSYSFGLGKRNGFDFLEGRAGRRSGSGGGGFDFLSGRVGKRNSRKVDRVRIGFQF